MIKAMNGKLYDCKHLALDDNAWSSRGLCPTTPAHGLTYHEFKEVGIPGNRLSLQIDGALTSSPYETI